MPDGAYSADSGGNVGDLIPLPSPQHGLEKTWRLHHPPLTLLYPAILYSDMAKVYEALKEFDNAKKYWNIVLKIEPDTSPLAREAQKRLFDLN